MIISHKYKFIFIKTLKTAGTSIEVKLSNYCGDEDVFTPQEPIEPGYIPRNHRGFFNPLPELFLNRSRPVRRALSELYHRNKHGSHFNALTIKSRITRSIWNSYYKFCVDRNPFDKCVSMFEMNFYNKDIKDFDKWLSKGKYPHGLPFYCDLKGNVLVDRILRYEDLENELRDTLIPLGLPYDQLDVTAKGHFRKKKKNYRTYYNDYRRNLVEVVFKEELEMNKYQF